MTGCVSVYMVVARTEFRGWFSVAFWVSIELCSIFQPFWIVITAMHLFGGFEPIKYP